MSDTPRTDAEAFEPGSNGQMYGDDVRPDGPCVTSQFARSLERELAYLVNQLKIDSDAGSNLAYTLLAELDDFRAAQRDQTSNNK